LKKEIQEIILNENYNNVDKLIAIAKVIDNKDEDWFFALSEVFGLSVEMIKSWDLSIEIKKPVKKSKAITVKDYIDLFFKCYLSIHGRKYKMVNRGKDIGQFNNIKKSMEIKKFRSVLGAIYKVNLKGTVKEKKEFEFLIKNLSPGIILSQYNQVMNKVKSNKKGIKKEWQW